MRESRLTPGPRELRGPPSRLRFPRREAPLPLQPLSALDLSGLRAESAGGRGLFIARDEHRPPRHPYPMSEIRRAWNPQRVERLLDVLEIIAKASNRLADAEEHVAAELKKALNVGAREAALEGE